MFFMGNGTRKIDHGQQGENKGLNKGNEKAEEHEDHRNEERNETEKYRRYKVVTGYVTEKPDAKGHGPCYVADELDGAHEDAQNDVGIPGHGVTDKDKLLKISETVLTESVVVGKNKDGKGTGERGVDIVRSRKKTGNKSREVIEQDEECQRPDDEHELGTTGTHSVNDETSDKLDDQFDGVPKCQFLIGDDLVFGLPDLLIAEKYDNEKND